MSKKKILVVHYSQTGQLDHAIYSCTKPLVDDVDIEVKYLELKPKKPFPFPWSLREFLNVFPESVYCDSIELEEFDIEDEDFDLIIIAYQVWFLSPSLPITSFMKSEFAKKVLKDKPIITFIACRNMWLTAQEKMKDMIKEGKGVLIDNIVLVDQGNSYETFITTPRWMLTGRKNSFWGLSEAGISMQCMEKSSRFSEAIKEALKEDKEKEKKPLLKGLGAVNVNEKLIIGERIGHRSFLIWGRFLRWLGKKNGMIRQLMLYVYMIFLVLMIVTVLPISLIIRAVLYPLLKQKLKKQKRYFEEPSGSTYNKGV